MNIHDKLTLLQSDWTARILARWYASCILSEPDPFFVANGWVLRLARVCVEPVQSIPHIKEEQLSFSSAKIECAKSSLNGTQLIASARSNTHCPVIQLTTESFFLFL